MSGLSQVKGCMGLGAERRRRIWGHPTRPGEGMGLTHGLDTRPDAPARLSSGPFESGIGCAYGSYHVRMLIYARMWTFVPRCVPLSYPRRAQKLPGVRSCNQAEATACSNVASHPSGA